MKRKPKDRRESGEGSCLYQCELCGFQEQVPKDVLEYFDAIDPGLPGQPATFGCQNCPGIMYPLWWLHAERAAP
jgi:hypothetical protein